MDIINMDIVHCNGYCPVCASPISLTAFVLVLPWVVYVSPDGKTRTRMVGLLAYWGLVALLLADLMVDAV